MVEGARRRRCLIRTGPRTPSVTSLRKRYAPRHLPRIASLAWEEKGVFAT